MRVSISAFQRLPMFSTTLHTLERRFRLHALTVGCGHSIENHQEYDWSGLNRGEREFAVVQYTLTGKGHLSYEGTERDILPGQLMVVHVPHNHRYRLPEDSSRWEFIYLTLVGREVLRMVKRVEGVAGPLLDVTDGSPLLFALYQILRYALSHEYRTLAPKPFELSDLTYHAGMKLLEEVLPYSPASEPPTWLKRVQSYCRGHLAERIEVSQLASLVGFSRSHFSREFAAHLAMSPQEYLIQERIKHAIQLLYDESLSIKQISYLCGYHDVNYFCRIFKKVIGMPPGEYRKSGI